MRDGLTRKRRSHGGGGVASDLLRCCRTKLVLVNTAAAGAEYRIDRERVIIGRGPGVDLAFDDPDMSRQHASIEITDEGLQIRDLGSTNGLFLNGSPVRSAEIGNGDHFEIGSLRFQLVVEQRVEEPDVFEIPAEP